MRIAKDLLQTDNYDLGLISPIQRRFRDRCWRRLRPLQLVDSSRDMPWAAIAIMPNVVDDPARPRRKKVCEITAERNLYRAEELSVVYVSRIPYEQLAYMHGEKGKRKWRLNLLVESFYLDSRDGRLAVGGPRQPRKARQYKIDESPLQNVPILLNKTAEAGVSLLRAPIGGVLSVDVRMAEFRGKEVPWFVDLVIRDRDRDILVFRLDADDLDNIEWLTKDGEPTDTPVSRYVCRGDVLCRFLVPTRYAERKWKDHAPDQRIRRDDVINCSRKPELTEVATMLLEDIVNRSLTPAELRAEGTPALPPVPELWNTLPYQLFEITAAPAEHAVDYLRGADVLATDHIKWRLLAQVRNATEAVIESWELSDDVSLLLMDEQARVLESWTALVDYIGPRGVDELMEWFVHANIIFSGQHGYNGPGWLLSSEILDPGHAVILSQGNRYLYFPEWEKYFHPATRSYIVPAFYHPYWDGSPCGVNGPMAPADNEDDPQCFSMHGIAYSCQPVDNLLTGDPPVTEEPVVVESEELVPSAVY
jgi:hypothetical protein